MELVESFCKMSGSFSRFANKQMSGNSFYWLGKQHCPDCWNSYKNKNIPLCGKCYKLPQDCLTTFEEINKLRSDLPVEFKQLESVLELSDYEIPVIKREINKIRRSLARKE